jgi:hypothetical protein
MSESQVFSKVIEKIMATKYIQKKKKMAAWMGNVAIYTGGRALIRGTSDGGHRQQR